MATQGRGRRDVAPLVLILAQVPLLLASALLGAGLSMQSAVTATRITQARAEVQSTTADALVLQANADLEALTREAEAAQIAAFAEFHGTGGTGVPGIGEEARRLMSEAAARRDAASRQKVLAQGLAESAQQEVVRSALAADDQERVASQSNTLGAVFAATALVMLVLAELLRRRGSKAEAKREDGWKAGLTRSIEDIADRVAEMGQKLNAAPPPRRRWRFGRRRWTPN